MKYLGGKHGIGKLLSEFMINQCPPETVDGYIEPFCGSLGVFKNMTNKGYKKYIASDFQPDLIEMWKKIQNSKLKIPDEITEETYNKLKHTKSPNALKAVAGFGLSFGGKYFAGYAQKSAGNSGRNFLNEFKKSIEKIKPKIQDSNIHFYNKSYIDYNPSNMLIYCDPPYKSTEGYSTGEFDHELFWETMRKWSKNNYVFISEENAPSDFIIVWEKQKRRTLDKKNRFYRYEKLYAYNSKTAGSFAKNNLLSNYMELDKTKGSSAKTEGIIDKPTIIKLIKNISKEQAIKDYKKLETFNFDELTNETRKGNKFVDYFTFQERLNTIGIKGMSYWDFVSNTEYLNRPYIKRMIDNQGDTNNYVALYQIFKLHCGSIGLFSPIRAIDVLSQFGISSILDPCVGWGSALVAASVLNIPSFIGIDTNKNLEQPHNDMINLLVNELETTTEFTMLYQDAITIDYSKLDYDCVFTSPPYYNKELYSYCNKRTNKQWDDEFYRPLLTNTFKYLKVGGYYILNVPINIYQNICIEIMGEADIIMNMKRKAHPKNKKTNKDYTEFIYVWLKKP